MAKYKRDAAAVLSQLKENQAGQILTKVACKIQVPVRYSDVGLGEVGINTFIYGLFPIILETGQYAVMNVCALVEINPSKTGKTQINGVDYHEFSFDENTVLIKTTDVVKRETLMYNIFDEFIFKGKIPWYVDYEDLGEVFDTAMQFANSKVSQNPEIIEFLASMVTRSKSDRTKYIRTLAKTYGDVTLDKVDYVPLMSVFYSVNNTVNKIAGSYFSDGIVSALTSKSTEVEKIESILRS